MADENLTIKLRTKGQQLILVHDAPLATGAINALYVQIEFDPSWDGIYNKVVNFYKSWTQKSVAMPVVGDTVTIPAEILKYYEDPDTGCWDTHCWIQVMGYTDKKTLTTNRLHTKIAIGGRGEAEIDPDPTLYEQLLASIEAGGGGGRATQADWLETNPASLAFIKNKPDLGDLGLVIVDGKLCVRYNN